MHHVSSVAVYQKSYLSQMGCNSNTELTGQWLWQVISIPYFKWEALTTLQARSQYLRELLLLSSQGAQEAGPATTVAAVPSLQGIGSHLGLA